MTSMALQTVHLCCACHRFPSIENSHAIPRSYFRNISRKNNGQIIVLSDGSSPARKSNDDSKSAILCIKCEKDFDIRFDRTIIEAIRKIRKTFNSGEKYISFDNSIEIRRSIASILWRCSKSDSIFYKLFKPAYVFENMLECDWRLSNEPELSYNLEPLADSHPNKNGGFTSDALEDIIVVPRLLGVNHGYAKRKSYGFGTVFIIGGVIVTAAAPRLSLTRERRSGYLRSDGKLTLNGVSIWDVPFLKDFFEQAVRKELQKK